MLTEIYQKSNVMNKSNVYLLLTGILMMAFLVSQMGCNKGEKQNTSPIAAFTVNPSTGPVNTQFTLDASGSTDAEDPPTSLLVRWDWENNGTWETDWSSNKIISHQYNQPGYYTIALEVKDIGGLSSSTTRNVTVTESTNVIPVAAFTGTPTSGTSPLTVNFTDQSTNNPTSWQWNFGDGGTSTQKNPSHTYNSAGTYTVELLVSNGYGSDTEFKNNYITVTTGGGTGEPCPGIPTVTYEGQVYNTVLIGSQCWMKENLNYATGNSWCYNNNSSNCDTYGRLYDWATIMNGAASSNGVPSGVQGICPPGWHVPSNAEWDIIANHLGGSSVAGGKIKEAGYAHWVSPNTGATNESGFTALPGGVRYTDGSFSGLGFYCYWWSSAEFSSSIAWYRGLNYDNANMYLSNVNKTSGFSLRCLKD